jgi:alpha-methylacyl-CoA racemase
MPGAERGPLCGVRIVEFAGLAPAPFAGLLLADLGADVVRIDRPDKPGEGRAQVSALGRGRRSIALNLKDQFQVSVARKLVDRADVLIEGFRPGVMERLGLGPAECCDSNPRLVYGRLTGWGQTGTWAQMAGHDLNYIAVSGVLEPMGPQGQPPTPPLNLVGDFAGGGMLLALGVMAALLERIQSGHGQVIDAAMVDGAALLGTFVFAQLNRGRWSPSRGSNALDGSAPFYATYETADGRYVSVAAIEPQFYAELLGRLGLNDIDPIAQHDRAGWPRLRQRLKETFRHRTRDEWEAVFAGSDACVAPVLSPHEASRHPFHHERKTFVDVGDGPEPVPAPRFSRTPGQVASRSPNRAGQDTEAILRDWGCSTVQTAALPEFSAASVSADPGPVGHCS